MSRSTAFDPFEHPICFATPTRIAHSTWMGHVPFAMLLVDMVSPGVLVELGTYAGVSYCAFCQAVKELKIASRCFGVDTWQGDTQSGFYGTDILNELKEFHDPLYGSFSQLIRGTFDEAIERFEPASVDLLHIDGCHTYEAVKHDFETWRPKMSRRGVVLFHDIAVREGDYGAWRLWEEVSAAYPHFHFDHAYGLGLAVVGTDGPPALLDLCYAPRAEQVPYVASPASFPSCSKAEPTPPEAPWISARWPGATLAERWIIWYAVM